MNFLPIVHRELLLAARRRATYLSRSLLAGSMVLIWLVVSVSMSRHMSMSELARSLFWTYGILAMLYALLSGVFFTADALSIERRDGTLGLLFLTDLKGYDVVLGKLVATSWHGFSALLVIFPVLTLPLLLGGVSHTEMVRFVVLVVSTTFYSLALGLLVSTLCRRLVAVVSGTVLILFVQCVLPWLVVLVLDEFSSIGAEDVPLVFLCPFTAMGFMPDMHYRTMSPGGWIASGSTGFWMPVWVMICLGSMALAFACGWLPRAWRRDEEPRMKPAQPRTIASEASAPGDALPPESRSRPWLGRLRRPGIDPCRWLALRQRTRSGVFNGVFLGLVCVWLCFAGLTLFDVMSEMAFVVSFFGAFVLHVIAKGWMALVASRRFAEERQSGAMELLLVSPVQPRDIIRGEMAALKRGFALPMLLLTGVNVLLTCIILGLGPVHMGDDRWWVAEIVVWGAVVLWLDAQALVHVGMFAGLRKRNHHRAVLATMLRVMVPPWAGVVFFFLFIMLPGGLSEEGFIFCMNGWFILSALLDLVLVLHMKSTLEVNLRRLCAGEQIAYGGPLQESPLPGGPSLA